MPRYTDWASITKDQGNIVGSRLANEMEHRFVGVLRGFSKDDQRDASIAELLAATPDVLSVKSFGAKGDGVADDTEAIQAAIDAGADGTLGIDEVSTIAQDVVYFPPGDYHHTGLTYKGGPWLGAGSNAVFLTYNGDGASVDAVGTNTARKLLNISHLSLVMGTGATTAYGLRLGYNQRSLRAMDNVHIRGFPAHGILFDDDTWIMSFYNVYVSFCASTSGSGIGVSSATTTVASMQWYNLMLEQNGQALSSIGGGIEIDDTSVRQWSFHGGVWEGNKGDSEARFKNCDAILISGVYLESSLAAAGVDNALIFAGTVTASVQGCFITAVASHADIAIRAVETSVVSIDNCWFHAVNWAAAISVEATAKVTLLSEGNLVSATASHQVQVVDGSIFDRLSSTTFDLTDASSIVVVASKSNIFKVTLTDNRTMAAPSAASEGQRITFLVIQDGTGGRTLAWNAIFKNAWSDTGNTLNKRSMITFRYYSGAWNQEGAQSPYY